MYKKVSFTWKELAKQFKNDLWCKEVATGYTVSYTWMANQLGHFAIGFVPAVFMQWYIPVSLMIIKEYFDVKILPKYIDKGVPVFGICRGIQTIAVLFGGTLIQDIKHHETNDTLDREKAVHNILITHNKVDIELASQKGYNRGKGVKVNSLHHQCVSGKNFPNCLEIVATYTGKSNYVSIEALKHSTLPIMGVQYHPEEMGYDPLSDYMIKKLISKSKNYA